MSRKPFQNITVLKGGISAERDVSLESGATIAGGLRAAGYTVEEIDVTSREFALSEKTDAVFIALHGTFGEDGGVQKILEEKGIPFTGADSEASRVAFDKYLTDVQLRAAGVPVPDCELIRTGDTPSMTPPVAVKPPRQGSSVGCSLVFDEAGYPAALADAWKYSDDILIQRFIPGREFTVGIVDRDILPAVEIIPESGWYDYAAKYKSDATRYVVPAELDAATAQRISDLALRTFDALGARGFGRVDFRMNPAGELYVLELNTIPGFTAHSLLPKAAAAAGIPLPDLCDRIIRTAG